MYAIVSNVTHFCAINRKYLISLLRFESFHRRFTSSRYLVKRDFSVLECKNARVVVSYVLEMDLYHFAHHTISVSRHLRNAFLRNDARQRSRNLLNNVLSIFWSFEFVAPDSLSLFLSVSQ